MTRSKILLLNFFLLFFIQNLTAQHYRYKAKGGSIEKTDQQDNVIWSAKIFEKSRFNEHKNEIFGIESDNNNDIFIGGRFTIPIDVDPGSDVVEINPGNSVNWFFLKLNESGQFKWVKVLSPNTYESFKTSIDNQGNYYIYGLLKKSIDFDPGANEYIVPHNGNTNGYILKLNNDGLFEWVKQVIGNPYANIIDFSFDKNQDMVFVGSFSKNSDLNPDENANYQLNTTSPLAVYVAKWNADGNFIWAKSYSGNQPIYPQHISIDKQNNIFIGGNHEGGLIDLDPGGAEFLIEGNGKSDIYMQKLNSSGNLLWAKSIGGVSDDEIFDVESDSKGNLYVTGVFNYSLNFNPENEGSIYKLKTRLGSTTYREFIQKYNPSGNLIWTRVFNKLENFRDIYITLPNEDTIIGTEIRIPNVACFDDLEYRSLIIDDLDNMNSSNSIILSEVCIENSEQLHIISDEVILEKNVEIDQNSNVLIEGRNGCD